ncbi:MAG: class I SAM-dependent methyltransferase [Hyphomicrobiales bacterium]|jgi:tRNA (cmo5U34)-methyltransferase|nr:class I SAM-dependent methyltransferase [Hyphomicrobiales bacterium]
MNPTQIFNDPVAVAAYAERAQRQVPGFSDLQRMAMLLLAEHAPGAADILVLGAGGGLELKLFAEAQKDWRLLGVDPSAAMLDLARLTLGPLQSRATLIEGTIDAAPLGPFDGAACLLTLHFLPRDERLRTLREVRRRLKPGAPFVVAHHSYSKSENGRRWLSRFADFAVLNGVDAEKAAAMPAALFEHLPALSPEEDQALLQEAGFNDVALFYAALTFRGWVALA